LAYQANRYPSGVYLSSRENTFKLKRSFTMRDLTIYEVEQVSGGYGNGFMADLIEAATSSVLGATVAGAFGAIIGGKNGGTGGGWGFGSLGQLVGMIGGGLIGMAAGAVGAPIVGMANTWNLAQGAIIGFINGTFKP
jgi:hypothetical protein